MKTSVVSYLRSRFARGGRIALFSLLLALVLSLGGSFHASTAHAGTNGQEIGVRTAAHSIKIFGTNQNGFPEQPCVVNINTTNEVVLANWWWVGNTDVNYYSTPDCTGTPLGDIGVDVPGVMSGNICVINGTPPKGSATSNCNLFTPR